MEDFAMFDIGDVSLVLAGGGANGAIGAGMMFEIVTALRNAGIPLRCIGGVSVGTINASSVERLDQLIPSWCDTARRGQDALLNRWGAIPRALTLATSWFSRRGLKRIVRTIDVASVLASETEIVGLAWDEVGWKTRFFSNRDTDFKENPELWRDFVEAGCCIPSIFPAKEINGVYYSDAFWPSIRPMLKRGGKTLIICSNDQPQGLKPWEESWIRRFRIVINRSHDEVLEHKLESALAAHKGTRCFVMDAPTLLARRVKKKIRSPFTEEAWNSATRRIVVLTPSASIPGLSSLGFTEKGIIRGIAHGRERARKLLDILGI